MRIFGLLLCVLLAVPVLAHDTGEGKAFTSHYDFPQTNCHIHVYTDGERLEWDITEKTTIATNMNPPWLVSHLREGHPHTDHDSKGVSHHHRDVTHSHDTYGSHTHVGWTHTHEGKSVDPSNKAEDSPPQPCVPIIAKLDKRKYFINYSDNTIRLGHENKFTMHVVFWFQGDPEEFCRVLMGYVDFSRRNRFDRRKEITIEQLPALIVDYRQPMGPEYVHNRCRSNASARKIVKIALRVNGCMITEWMGGVAGAPSLLGEKKLAMTWGALKQNSLRAEGWTGGIGEK